MMKLGVVRDRPRRLPLITLLLLVIAASGCGRAGILFPADQVRKVIGETEKETRRFVYKERTSDDREVTVVGFIEDDYGYRARISINGQAAMDEVAVDDALAVRFLLPETIPDFLAESVAPPVGEAFDTLRSRRWVLDRAGAPDLTRPGFQARTIGDDPMLDALTVFDLVRKVMNDAQGVRKYERQALDYVERDDRFPRPADGSEVTRYDFVPAVITPITGGPNDILPDTPNFRRMSIYARDGKAIRVLELIDLSFRFTELTEALDLKIENTEARAFLATALKSLNDLRVSRGLQPIQLRSMSYELVDVGKPVNLALPTEYVEGSLNFLRNRGKGAGALPTSGSGTGTPTIPTPAASP